jgi:hypothetical protein
MKVCRIALIGVLALAGCSKIHEKREFSLELGGMNSLVITAPLSEQKVKVILTADQPVNIYVMLDKDFPQGKEDVDLETLKTGILGTEKNTKDATLDVTVPAKEKFRIVVGGATKKTNVTVKVDSQ